MGSERKRSVALPRGTCLSSLLEVSWHYLDKKNIEGRFPLGNLLLKIAMLFGLLW